MSLDVLYLSFNRWEFTERTLSLLVANTPWEQVGRFVVYDDGSEPQTLAKLEAFLDTTDNLPFELRRSHHRSPVGVMVDYLQRDPAEAFAKIDNDVCVPPGWLEALQSAWAVEPLDLLGMEVGHPHGLQTVEGHGDYRCVRARHIGGVGLMRTGAFLEARRLPKPVGRFGFTEWQHTYQPARGWVFPEINCPCLDRMPTEPWVSLSAFYEQVGWQRPWWKYPLEASHYWEWMGDLVEAHS